MPDAAEDTTARLVTPLDIPSHDYLRDGLKG